MSEAGKNPYEAPRGPTEEPLPKLKIATRLEDAKADTLVLVDRRGRVRGRGYRYFALAMLLLVLGAIGAALVWAIRATFGAFDILALAPVIAIPIALVLVVVRLRQSTRAILLIQHDRLDEAEEVVRGQLRNPLFIGISRAVVRHNLAVIHLRRGHHALALEEIRLARKTFGVWPYRRSLRARMALAAELEILLALGKIADAERLFEEVRRFPDGEYYALMRDTLGLLLDFHRGSTNIAPDVLQKLTERARTLAHRTLLAALCAWACESRGAHAEAVELAKRAIDTKSPIHLDRAAPQVHAWLVTFLATEPK